MVFLQMLREGWKMSYVVTEKGGHGVDFYAAHPIDKRKRLVQVSYEMPSGETLKREVEALIQASEELGVKEQLIVTWDDEDELDGGISVVPAWRFLLGLLQQCIIYAEIKFKKRKTRFWSARKTVQNRVPIPLYYANGK